MSFLNPLLLTGLLAVAIPVIIHIINLRRPQKVSFSTLAFFKKLQESTIKRIKIKKLLLLAVRLAAVICLALALARPFLPPVFSFTADSSEPRQIGIMIDNSPSMAAIDEKGPHIEQARQLAKDIVEMAKEGDSFFIQTTNGEARSGSAVSGSRATELIDEIKVVQKGNYLKQHLSQLKQAQRQSASAPGTIYIISDGQKSQLRPLINEKELNEADESDKANMRVQLIAVGKADQRNLAVSKLTQKSRLISKNNPVNIEVEVTNFSEAAVSNQFVSLTVEGEMAGQYRTDLEPGQSTTFAFEIIPRKTGTVTGKVVLDGDDITFDNNYYFSLKVPEKRSVLLVQDDSEDGGSENFISYIKPALTAANATNAQVQFDEISRSELDKSDWRTYNAVIVDGLEAIPEYLFNDLQNYVQEGNGIMFFPSEKGDIDNYNAFFELFNAGKIDNIRGSYASFESVTRIQQLTPGHPILDDMFELNDEEDISLKLPEIFYYYKYKPGMNSGGLTILETITNDDLLVERSFGEGTVLLSMLGADPGWSNFPVNPLFAPLYFRTVLYATSSEDGGFQNHELGKPVEVTTPGMGQNITIVKDSTTIKPDVKPTRRKRNTQLISYSAKEWEPGWATIKGDSGKIDIALNQSIMESDLATLTRSELENVANKSLTITSAINTADFSENQLDEELRQAGFGKEIWHWFILAATLLLIMETLISRMYRAEKNS